jgi:hypothetical protein
MRHLGSLLLAAVIAPLVWVLMGIGSAKSTGDLLASQRDVLAIGVGVAALLAAGLCYAPLVLARLSPIGPMLAGVAFLGAGLWALVLPRSFTDAVPDEFLGVPGALERPGFEFAVLLAVPLLLTALSARRWHRYAASQPAWSGYAPAYPPAGPYPPATYPPTSYPPGGAAAGSPAESEEQTVPFFPPGFPPAPAPQPATQPYYPSGPSAVLSWPPTTYPPGTGDAAEGWRRTA